MIVVAAAGESLSALFFEPKPEVGLSADESAQDEDAVRSAQTEALWADVRIEPVEIALPGGVGYTLRAYRSSTDVDSPRAPAGDDEETLDEFDAASASVAGRRRDSRQDGADNDRDEVDDTGAEATDEYEDEDDDEEGGEDEDDEGGEDEEDAEQEIPIFLGSRGRVFLFHSPQMLVEFVKSDAEHDLKQLDTWPLLASRISAADVVALPEDTYELDLVVDNLRGGNDAWDPELLLKAGEVARDLGFALRLSPVISALGPGSPLDDLDEALRAVQGGGLAAILGRRRLRKIPAQQTSLAWRTLIGKISSAARWCD